jgi:threonine/homoserine/homoserine lactone efflux protein
MDTLKAFVFGITLAVAIGPIAILIINRGLVYGFRSGLMSGVGAALADFTYALVAFTAGSVLVGYLHVNHVYFSWVASAALMLFGVWMLAMSLRKPADKVNAILGKPHRGDFGYLTSTYLLTIVNPLTIVVFVGFSGQLITPVFTMWQVVSLSLAIFLGSLLIQAVLASVGATMGRYVKSPAVIRMLNLASSLCIIGFGVAGLLQV